MEKLAVKYLITKKENNYRTTTTQNKETKKKKHRTKKSMLGNIQSFCWLSLRISEYILPMETGKVAQQHPAFPNATFHHQPLFSGFRE